MNQNEGQIHFASSEDMIRTASELLESQDPEEVLKARRIFEYLLDNLDRDNPGVLFALAVSYMRQNRLGMAETFYRYALTFESDESTRSCTLNNLGFVCNMEGRLEEALDLFHQAIAIDPNQGEFYNNIATAYINTGTPDLAIEWAHKALDTEPGQFDAQWNMGLAYLEKGEFGPGWEGYAAGLQVRPNSSQQRKIREYGSRETNEAIPYWDGAKGKTVVVYGEQGVGDEIMAFSTLPDAMKDADIIVETHPRLVSIIRHSFDEQFPIYGTRKVPWQDISFPNWHNLEAKAPLFNLCGLYRQKVEDFPRVPYLKAFDSKVDKYREKLRAMSDRPKIGFSWKGGSVITRQDLRSIPLEEWEELIRSVDADWISLQYDPADNMGWNTNIAKTFEERTGLDIHHEQDVVNDLDECYGGLIHAVDLVISVNNSLVHACGAYGVPCWTLTPSRPAWRYQIPGVNPLGDDKMIWYGDHVRQIRQVGDDWGTVLGIVQKALKGMW